MKGLFIYDLPIISYQDGFYSRFGTNDKLFERYLQLCDNLTIIGRNDEISFEMDDSIISKLDKIVQHRVILFSRHYANIFSLINKEIKSSDIVIIRAPSISSIIAYYFLRKYKVRFILELVGDTKVSLRYHGSFIAKLIEPIYTMLTKYIVKKSNNVMYVSQRYLQMRYPNKKNNVGCADVILEPHSLDILNMRLNRIRVFTEPIIIGLIGSLDVRYRGHDVVLRIIKYGNDNGLRIKAKFLGAGNKSFYLEMAKKLGVNDKIEFCGSLPNGIPVLNWIDNIDVLVMPTKAETLGRAIIEAMSRGCPVIGSENTAIYEQIGVDCIFKTSDYIGIFEKIKYMYFNRKYMENCAYENYYRSKKYSQCDLRNIRNSFYEEVMTKEVSKK